jgi:hypothetical protein
MGGFRRGVPQGVSTDGFPARGFPKGRQPRGFVHRGSTGVVTMGGFTGGPRWGRQVGSPTRDPKCVSQRSSPRGDSKDWSQKGISEESTNSVAHGFFPKGGPPRAVRQVGPTRGYPNGVPQLGSPKRGSTTECHRGVPPRVSDKADPQTDVSQSGFAKGVP